MTSRKWTMLRDLPSSWCPSFHSCQPPHAPTCIRPDCFNLGEKVTPGLLLVTTVVAILVFLSDLAHLLVRMIVKPRLPYRDDCSSCSASMMPGLTNPSSTGCPCSRGDLRTERGLRLHCVPLRIRA
ncbi:hypothetical protein MLD38_040723 [Melastoma candidum]|nr:hypothetical protein MLD38_040723 [Melastoma candidum]